MADMNSSYRARLKRLLRTALALCFCTFSGNAENASSDRQIYRVQAGENADDLARRFFGDSACLNELLNYNSLSDKSSIHEGAMLIVPGKERQNALTIIAEAAEAMEHATAAMAEHYAAAEVTRAIALLDGAAEQRGLAAYDKAAALASLALVRANEARSIADRLAPEQQEGVVSSAFGIVELSHDAGESWIAAKQADPLPVGSQLRTKAASRAEVTLRDGSIIQVRDMSIFSIDSFSFDPRNGKRQSALQVLMGTILGNIERKENEASTFNVKSGDATLGIRGTEFRIGADQEATARLSVLHGDVVMSANDSNLPLARDFGTFVVKDEQPKPPIPLLPPPVVTAPMETAFETAEQTIAFEWQPRYLPIGRWRRLLGVAGKPSASYRLEIATDEVFNRIVADVVTGAVFHRAGPFSPGEYYWRLSSIDGNGLEGPSTPPSTIRITRQQAVMIAATPEPVVRGAVWIIGPQHYLTVAANEDNTSVTAFEYSVDGRGYFPTDGRIFLRDDGTALLRVRGIAADGIPGFAAEQLVTQDSAPPNISIAASPLTADAIPGKRYAITIDAADEAGLDTIEYRIGDGAWRVYRGRLVISVRREAGSIHVSGKDTFGQAITEHATSDNRAITITCRARDVVGNIATKVLPLYAQ